MTNWPKRIILPSAEEIQHRLEQLSPEQPFLLQHYYPLIAKYEACQLSARGLVLLLVFCTRQLIGVVDPDVMDEFLGIKIKDMVDVLVDDPDVAMEAKYFYQRAFDLATS